MFDPKSRAVRRGGASRTVRSGQPRFPNSATPRGGSVSRSKPRPSSRRTSGVGRLKLALLATAGLIAFLLIGRAITANSLHGENEARISAGIQVDQNTVADISGFAETVGRLAERRAAEGGGTLTLYKGAGQKPVEVGHTDLSVEREGNPEQNAGLRARATEKKVTDLLRRSEAATVTGDGRDLLSLLQALAADKPDDGLAWDVVVMSFGLPTAEPSDTRILTAAEPAAAVSSLPAEVIPDLNGATVHWVFPAATGNQPTLNPRTTVWRKAFVQHLIERAGGSLVTSEDRNVPGTADPQSPSAPPVPNIPDPTPVPMQPLPVPPGAPVVTALDAGALFAPDSIVLIDESAARAQLTPLIAEWASGRYASVECIGRVAAFGSPEAGKHLSLERAIRIAEVLQSSGVPATPIGVGVERPLPGDPRGAHQRSVICTATPK